MTIFSGFAFLRVAIVRTRVARANFSNFVAANNRASAGSRIDAILRSLSDCGPIFSLLFSPREIVTGFTARHSAVSLALFAMAFLRNRNSGPFRLISCQEAEGRKPLGYCFSGQCQNAQDDSAGYTGAVRRRGDSFAYVQTAYRELVQYFSKSKMFFWT
jgi:hypothetical protein